MAIGGRLGSTGAAGDGGEDNQSPRLARPPVQADGSGSYKDSKSRPADGLLSQVPPRIDPVEGILSPLRPAEEAKVRSQMNKSNDDKAGKPSSNQTMMTEREAMDRIRNLAQRLSNQVTKKEEPSDERVIVDPYPGSILRN